MPAATMTKMAKFTHYETKQLAPGASYSCIHNLHSDCGIKKEKQIVTATIVAAEAAATGPYVKAVKADDAVAITNLDAAKWVDVEVYVQGVYSVNQ